jgi:hypothetical protein
VNADRPHGGALDDVERRAVFLIQFAAGQEDLGYLLSARRMRAVAEDVLRLAGELRLERVARQKIQADRELALTLLADRAGQAALRDLRRAESAESAERVG